MKRTALLNRHVSALVAELGHLDEVVVAEVRQIVGTPPTYCTNDMDFVDLAFAPGTGTPEIGGPNAFRRSRSSGNCRVSP